MTLSVARHSGKVGVPDVAGQTRPDAEAAIRGAGLEVRVTVEPSDTVAADLVISQSPAAPGKVDQRSTVEVVVSSGPPPTIPAPTIPWRQPSATSTGSAARSGPATVPTTATTIPPAAKPTTTVPRTTVSSVAVPGTADPGSVSSGTGTATVRTVPS